MNERRKAYPNELFHAINSTYDYRKQKRAKDARRINSAYDAEKYKKRYGIKNRSSSKTVKSPRINSPSEVKKEFGMSYEEAINSSAYDAILDAVVKGGMSLDEGAREFAKLLKEEPDDFHKLQVQNDSVIRLQDSNGYKVDTIHPSYNKRKR